MPGWSGHLTDWFLWDRHPLTPMHIAATGQELAGRRRRRLAGWLASRGGGGDPTALI
jgi:hypothetical protein